MENLVGYEVAKLSKEKGISIKCSHYFILPFSNFKPDFIPHKWNTDLGENTYQFVTVGRSQPHLAGAPTYSELAQVLRDTYDIHIFPSMYSGVGDYEFKIYIKGDYLKSGGFGLTFNQAFEKGLLEGLKQIRL